MLIARLTSDWSGGTEAHEGRDNEEEDTADDQRGDDAEDPWVRDGLVDDGPGGGGDPVESVGED